MIDADTLETKLKEYRRDSRKVSITLDFYM